MKHILIADDDRQMAKTLCAILRRQGWATTEVHSGEEAVAASRTQQFAVVLMDVRMSGMNGLDAFRAMRQARPATPVILMTAYAAPELLEEAEREGVLSILPKPIPWDALTALLDRVGALRGSVLVVDDDPAFLQSVAGVLARKAWTVRRATSLADAIRLLNDGAPQAVILDLTLDGREPRESVQAIHEVSPTTVLIVCSGHAALLDRTLAEFPAEWIHAGLTKPFPPDRLLDLLDALPHV